MKKAFSGKRLWIGIVTLSIIATIIGYYLLFYVKGREEEFREKKFRVLAQIGRNIKEKKSNLDKMAELHATSIAFWNKSKNELSSIIDAVVSKPFSHTLCKNPIQQSMDSLYWEDKVTDITGNTYTLVQSIPFAEFFKKMLHKSDFDEFLVIREGIDKHCDNSKKTKEDSCQYNRPPSFEVIYRSFDPWLRISKADSIIKETAGLKITNSQKITLRDVPFRTYIQQINIEENKHEVWIVIGLIKESNFRASTRSIQTWTVVQLSMLSLFLLLGMPLIKLWVMNIYERLQITTVWFAGMSIIIGAAVSILITLSIHNYWDTTHVQKNKLESLAKEIETRFIKDLGNQHKLLVNARDKILFKTIATTKGANNSGLFADTLYSKLSFNRDTLDSVLLTQFKPNPFFNEVMWFNKEGREDSVIATHTISNYLILPKLDGREYFQKSRHKDLWILNKDSFGLQSIFSRLTNQPEAGYSIPAKDDKVLAVATRLFSVMDVLLPPGYTFCIADESGKVLFHSTSQYNLQENILDELVSEKVTTSVPGRIEFDGVVKYHDTEHYLLTKPVAGIPLTIMVFKKVNHYTTPLTLTVTFASLFMISLFIMQGMQLLLLFLSSYRNSKLRMKRFFLHWMRPRNDEAYQNFYKQQTLAFIMILIVQILCTLFFYDQPKLILFFMIAPVYCAAWAYYQIKSIKGSSRNKHSHYIFSFASIGFIVALNIAFYFNSEGKDYWVAIVSQLLLIVILLSSSNLKLTFRKFETCYSWMLFLWLITVSVTPIFFFYKAGSYFENQIWNRYELLESSRKYIKHQTGNEILISNLINDSTAESTFQNEITDALNSGNYLFSTGEISKGDSGKISSSPNQYLLSFLQKIHPSYDSLVQHAYVGAHGHANDASWYSGRNEDSISLYYKANTYQNNPKVKPSITLSMNTSGLQFSTPQSIFICFTFVGVILWFIFNIIKFTVNRIYGNAWYNQTPKQMEIDRMLEILPVTKKIFYISLPGSNNNELLGALKKKYKTKAIELSFYKKDWPLLFPIHYQVVLLHGFEHDLSNQDFLESKFDIIKKYNEHPHLIVIICSTLHPTIIEESIKCKMRELESMKLDKDFRDEYKGWKSKWREWNNIMSQYSVIHNPLNYSHSGGPLLNSDDWLSKELSIGTHLPDFIKMLSPEIKELPMEDQVLLVEERCHPYYRSIWNSFTREEKFLLYDLAKDRYINLTNKSSINRLIGLGVIRKEDTLRLMNDSFGEFVLSEVSGDVELSMDIEAQRRGSWSSVQLVLILVLIGLVSFLAITQQHFFTQMNTLLTAVAAAAGLLLQFGGFFRGSKAKE